MTLNEMLDRCIHIPRNKGDETSGWRVIPPEIEEDLLATLALLSTGKGQTHHRLLKGMDGLVATYERKSKNYDGLKYVNVPMTREVIKELGL
jgi:hypothetical protein